MIGRVNHIAIAVPDLAAAAAVYSGVLGAEVSSRADLPEHGVSVVFVDLPNTRVELMAPLGEGSPIAAFLARNPSGGLHHVCYEVADLELALGRLLDEGAHVLGPPKAGAHGRPVIFLHPKDFQGTLIELEEA